MTTELRRFNEDGVARFRELLRLSLPEEVNRAVGGLVEHGAYTEPFAPSKKVAPIKETSKWAFIQVLDRHLQGVEVDPGDLMVWTWLAAYHFDRLCPAGKVGSYYRYIASADYRHYYRHLIAGPFLLYQMHGQRARLLLRGEVGVLGDVMEQLASRQQVVQTPSIVEAANVLYLDARRFQRDGEVMRRRTTSSDNPAGLREFVRVLKQFEKTYDLQSMTAETLLGLLPNAFQEWKPPQLTQRRQLAGGEL